MMEDIVMRDAEYVARQIIDVYSEIKSIDEVLKSKCTLRMNIDYVDGGMWNKLFTKFNDGTIIGVLELQRNVLEAEFNKLKEELNEL